MSCATTKRGPSPTRLTRAGARRRGRQVGFTLVELLVSVAIIGILLAISGLAMRGLSDSSVMAQAKNAVLTVARTARSYAITNHIETMIVVNPHTGRFEIWHLNPPAQGGKWDPQSSGDATVPSELWKTDGYFYAPVLDAAIRLPLDSHGKPAALVCPIDYDQRPAGNFPNGPEKDNLIWAAFCFDEHGNLVIRTRRIATRLNVNRLPDGSPDLTVVPLVDVGDTPITSTQGFVISDMARVRVVLGDANVTPDALVYGWLMQTRPGQRYADFAETVVLNRFSGGQLVGDD